jgi:hypothetical protein
MSSSSVSSPRARSYGTLVAFVAAVGFAVHLLGSETPSTTEPSPPPAPADLPAAPAADEPREAARAGTEPAHTAPEAQNPTPSAVEPTAPRVEELANQLAEDPDAVLRSLTRVLPKGEREAQKLKLLEVQALVKNGRIGAARGRASEYFERWPHGPDTATLEALTGAHPRNDAPR